jgi:2-keto-3-deoxy-L-fuconate dehydrogenase
MAGRLAGKTAFITAAAQGMGQAAALAFAREGAKVWATDINAQQLKSIEGRDGIRTRPLDVTDEAAIARIAQEAGDVEARFSPACSSARKDRSSTWRRSPHRCAGCRTAASTARAKQP